MVLQGKIIPRLSDIRDFSYWSVAFLEEFREVVSVYRRSWEDDHQISRLESQAIERELADLVGALIFFYLSFEKDHLGRNIEVEQMTLFMSEGDWRLSLERLPKKIELVDFLGWLQSLINGQIRGLFSEYLEALADGVISMEEKQSLQKRITALIREITYVIAFMRRIRQTE